MEFDRLKQYLLDKPSATLDHPFGPDVYVFKVKGKMFALIGYRGAEMNMNLKCEPEEGAALRDIFADITAGYHMNKRHWITINFTPNNSQNKPGVPDGEVFRLIDNSYDLVVNKLPKKDQRSLLLHQ